MGRDDVSLELWREVWGRLGGTRALTARSLGEESFWERTTTQEKTAQGRALANTRSSVRGTSQRWDVLVKDRVALQPSSSTSCVATRSGSMCSQKPVHECPQQHHLQEPNGQQPTGPSADEWRNPVWPTHTAH